MKKNECSQTAFYFIEFDFILQAELGHAANSKSAFLHQWNFNNVPPKEKMESTNLKK